MNINTTKNTGWGQLQEYQQNGVLEVFYERGISLMRLEDYVNTASTCSQWREALISKYYQDILKDMRFVSTPLFHKFVSEVQTIDRTDSPKFYRKPVIDHGLYIAHQLADDYETIPLSQRDYEIQRLESARDYSIVDHNQSIAFNEMCDEDRNNLLDVVNQISEKQLIKAIEIIELPIEQLIERYSDIIKANPMLESTLLRTNILCYEKKIDAVDKSRIQEQLILFIICILTIGALILMY